MKKQPNILLIMCDQLRWDTLGYMGNSVVQTPHIDQLASMGVSFSNAYTAVPSCIASRAALLTGMSQKLHGRTGYEDGVPFTYEHTLPGTLASHGYHTQSVGKNHFYPARNLCGYHNTVLMDGYLEAEYQGHKDYGYVDDYLKDLAREEGVDSDMVFHGVDCNSYLSRPWPYKESIHPTSWVTTQGIDFLRRRDPSKPYFLKLSYLAPHPPYIPPQEFLDMYRDVEMPSPVVGDWISDPGPLLDVNGFAGTLSLEQQQRLTRAYYAMITHMDYQIGRFLIHLKREADLSNTLVIFTSDHGEMLGDHHLYRKALPFNGSARIPLCMAWGPDVMEGSSASQYNEVVELRDIMPTLLDVAGVPLPDSVDGLSLKRLFMGEDRSWRTHLHGEHALCCIPQYEAFGSNHYVVTEKEKYIWFSETGKELFFDLSCDPHELEDLSEKSPHRVEVFRNILIEELSEREEGYVQNGKLVSGRTAKPTQSFLKK